MADLLRDKSNLSDSPPTPKKRDKDEAEDFYDKGSGERPPTKSIYDYIYLEGIGVLTALLAISVKSFESLSPWVKKITRGLLVIAFVTSVLVFLFNFVSWQAYEARHRWTEDASEQCDDRDSESECSFDEHSHDRWQPLSTLGHLGT